jgi:hypothetical protein
MLSKSAGTKHAALSLALCLYIIAERRRQANQFRANSGPIAGFLFSPSIPETV